MNYSEAQDKWRDVTGLKEGDKVLIICKAESMRGWNDDWVSEMDKYIGTVHVITSFFAGGVRLGVTGWNWPFFVLVKYDD